MFAILGRIYGVSPHLLSLERICYYIRLDRIVKLNIGKFRRFSYSLAVLILTPGPMVEAATQDLIY